MWRIVILIVFTIILAVFCLLEASIGMDVRNYSQSAQNRFPGKRVDALIAMVGCESCSMEDRNHAVWALGQLDDVRALAVLEKYYTGKECNHWKDLCQKTLGTALRHLRHEDHNRGEAYFWRWMLPAES